MKNVKFHFIFYIISALSAVVMTSCGKSFLEVTPKGKLIAHKITDYNLLLNNIQLVIINANGQAYLADDVAALDPYFSVSSIRNQRFFRWEEDVYDGDQVGADITSPVLGIYTYNKIINEVMDAEGGTEAEKKVLRAEALAGRAWSNFLMINYFGKPYNPATSANDPGIPIILEADVSQTKYERATVAKCYEQIVSDLTTAIADLPNRIHHRTRMSKSAALGLLGKVYVFMGKYDLALPILKESIGLLGNADIPVRLIDYNVALAPGGEFLPINPLTGPASGTIVDTKEIVYGKQNGLTITWISNDFPVTSETMALFAPTDLRLSLFSKNLFAQAVPLPNGMYRRIAPNGVYVGVNVPELYLLKAECEVRLNHLVDARADLETLRKNRMLPSLAAVPDEIAADKMKLLKYVFDERSREFAGQGLRWYDMRRLSVDPLFPNMTFTHKLFNMAGEVVKTFTLKPERMTQRFPIKIINANPGMENNP